MFDLHRLTSSSDEGQQESLTLRILQTPVCRCVRAQGCTEPNPARSRGAVFIAALRTINKCGIQMSSKWIIWMIPHLLMVSPLSDITTGPAQIFVCAPGNATAVVNVDGSDRIEDVRAQLQGEHGGRYRLVFGGQDLAHGRTVAE
jgi:hypothetical protein